MTASSRLYLLALGLAVLAWGTRLDAENDVTVISTPTSPAAVPKKTAASDGGPVVHKSLHKRKHSTAATNPGSGTPPTGGPSIVTVSPGTNDSTLKPATTPSSTANKSGNKSAAETQASAPVQPPVTVTVGPTGAVPTVETGLPVARQGAGSALFYTPLPMTTNRSTSHTLYASVLPSSVLPVTSAAVGNFSSPLRNTSSPEFAFTNFPKREKTAYPWKTGIITTEFWIGEGGSSISPTNNVQSSWDEHWEMSNHGTDSPNDRNGYATAEHASTVNPFYIALPFNDLAFPDKARRWLPQGWHRSPGRDGKPVSACRDRWVQIKNAQGRSCYAQWEDVGPLRYDHAEYVFGPERPDTYTRAGLDVSPAVAQYLDINENNRAITSWRFVDDEDVPPGQWLKYDEQAVIFTALHQLKSSASSSTLPIERATEPINDPESIDSNKKKIDAAKG